MPFIFSFTVTSDSLILLSVSSFARLLFSVEFAAASKSSILVSLSRSVQTRFADSL